MATGVESLYPFLYGDTDDPGRVRADVLTSTIDKITEIAQLRRAVATEHAAAIAAAASAMAERFDAGARLFVFGNGGSSSDAQAVTAMFCTPASGRALPAICLTNEVAVVTALANDVGFDVVFARQLAALGRPDDIAMGLSTSGGSANVLRAFEQAAQLGMLTVGLAGYRGGAMGESADIAHLFVVPSTSVHRIQEAQTTVYDVLWEMVQLALE